MDVKLFLFIGIRYEFLYFVLFVYVYFIMDLCNSVRLLYWVGRGSSYNSCGFNVGIIVKFFLVLDYN